MRWHASGLDLPVSSLAIDPSSPSTLYAGVPAGPSPLGGIRKSTDGGTTWTPAGTGLVVVGQRGVNALAVDPSAPAIVYAVTDAGVFSTRGGGASWSPTGLSARAFVLAIDPGRPSTVYARTENRGVIRLDIAPCTADADCGDGDDCTTDRCDPPSTLGDFRGCVHDRRGFPGVACAVRAARASAPCGDESLGPRLARFLAVRLGRAERRLARAEAASRARANRFLRAARRSVSAIPGRARRAARAGRISRSCRDEVIRIGRDVDDMLRALLR